MQMQMQKMFMSFALGRRFSTSTTKQPMVIARAIRANSGARVGCMATSSNIEPRDAAFYDPAHENCHILAARWGWRGDGVRDENGVENSGGGGGCRGDGGGRSRRWRWHHHR